MKVVYTVEGIWLSSTYIPPKLATLFPKFSRRFCESEIIEIIPFENTLQSLVQLQDMFPTSMRAKVHHCLGKQRRKGPW